MSPSGGIAPVLSLLGCPWGLDGGSGEYQWQLARLGVYVELPFLCPVCHLAGVRFQAIGHFPTLPL